MNGNTAKNRRRGTTSVDPPAKIFRLPACFAAHNLCLHTEKGEKAPSFVYYFLRCTLYLTSMSSSKPPPTAAAAAAAAPNEDELLAQRLTLMDQLTNIYGFPHTAAADAIEALCLPDSDLPDLTVCCNYIIEQGLAPDAGGPVIPKENCPHVSSLVNASGIDELLPVQPASTICQHHTLSSPSVPSRTGRLKGESTSDGGCPGTENWWCLSCGVVLCSRYVNGHALQHWEETKSTMDDGLGHCVAVSLSDFSTWCHACNAYIVNDSLRHVQAELERRKFPPSASTAEPHPKRQRSGTLSSQPDNEEMHSDSGSALHTETQGDEIRSTSPPPSATDGDNGGSCDDSQANEEHEGESLGEEDEEVLFQMITEAARAQGIPLQWILSQMHGIPIQAEDEGPVEYPWDSLPRTLPEIAEFIKSDQCKRILVLAGAGMSVVRLNTHIFVMMCLRGRRKSYPSHHICMDNTEGKWYPRLPFREWAVRFFECRSLDMYRRRAARGYQK